VLSDFLNFFVLHRTETFFTILKSIAAFSIAEGKYMQKVTRVTSLVYSLFPDYPAFLLRRATGCVFCKTHHNYIVKSVAEDCVVFRAVFRLAPMCAAQLLLPPHLRVLARACCGIAFTAIRL